MAAKVSVDTSALASHGRGLAGVPAGSPCGPCEPAAADAVSTAVAASFTAWTSRLDALITLAASQRAEGGLAVDLTAAALQQGDEEAAAHIATGGRSPAMGAVPTLPGGGAVVPDLPVAPPVPAVSDPGPVEVWSRMIHGGPGSEPLQALARRLRSTAEDLSAAAGDTEVAGVGVDATWDDGDQPAGDRIRGHAQWLSGTADYARQLAAAAEAAAAAVDTARDGTPTPETFTALAAQYRRAQQTYASSGGAVSEPLVAATANLQEAKARGRSAQDTYLLSAGRDSSSVPDPPQAPPPIVPAEPASGDDGQARRPGKDGERNPREAAKDDGAAGEETDSEQDVEDVAVDDTVVERTLDSGAGVGEAGPPPDEAGGDPVPDAVSAAVPSAAFDPAANAAGVVLGSILGVAGQSGGAASGLMPGSGGGLPMSGLSGLPSLPGTGGSPSLSPPQLGPDEDGLDRDEEAFGTRPASSGGGGGGGGGGLPAAPPVSGPAAAGPGVGSVPATPSTPATGAGAGASRMPMGGMMPPMMGGMGGGPSDERDKDLHPDRRVVHRRAANTEPVFGELEQVRKRPGRRRAAATQEGSTGDTTHDDK